MTNVLAKYEFVFRGICNCFGPKTLKYKKGDYTVYWNRTAKKFRIKHHGKAITILMNENEMDAKLKEIFPQATEDTPA